MTTILQINSAARSQGAQSTLLVNELTSRLQQSNPGAKVVTRNLQADPLPHLDDAVLDRVPVATQYEAFYLVLYREAVFDGFVKNADLRGGDGGLDDTHRLALVNLAARLTGDKPEIAAIRV